MGDPAGGQVNGMWVVIVVLSVLAAAVLLAVLLIPSVRRSRGVPRGDTDVIDADVEPPPDPSARRPDGGPLAGSPEDRRQHGQR